MIGMQSFFESMPPWPRNDGSLHLYVVPEDADLLERLTAAQELLAGFASLPPMPRSYLHCTVQRLAHFDDDVRQAELTALGAQLNRRLAEVPAFDLELGAPQAHRTAVGCEAAPSAAWDRLVATVRDGVVDAWPGELPPPPHGPHLSLAYATGDVDTAQVQQRLAEVPPIGQLHVATVHLVSVTVRPEIGIFDFVTLADWDLAR